MNKAQGRRSRKLIGYYKNQFAVTTANKTRRKLRRLRQQKAKCPS